MIWTGRIVNEWYDHWYPAVVTETDINLSVDDQEQKRRQFFEEELKRLQKSLKDESSKIIAPPVWVNANVS